MRKHLRTLSSMGPDGATPSPQKETNLIIALKEVNENSHIKFEISSVKLCLSISIKINGSICYPECLLGWVGVLDSASTN